MQGRCFTFRGWLRTDCRAGLAALLAISSAVATRSPLDLITGVHSRQADRSGPSPTAGSPINEGRLDTALTIEFSLPMHEVVVAVGVTAAQAPNRHPPFTKGLTDPDDGAQEGFAADAK